MLQTGMFDFDYCSRSYFAHKKTMIAVPSLKLQHITIGGGTENGTIPCWPNHNTLEGLEGITLIVLSFFDASFNPFVYPICWSSRSFLQHIYQSRTSFPLMASVWPRHHLSPTFPADYIAPTRDSVTRTYNMNPNAKKFISQYSHMTKPLPSTSRVRPEGYSSAPNNTTEDDTVPRFELFLLGEGEKKVTEEADTREFSFSSSSEAADTHCFLHLLLDLEKPTLLSMSGPQTCPFQTFSLHPYPTLAKRSILLLTHNA